MKTIRLIINYDENSPESMERAIEELVDAAKSLNDEYVCRFEEEDYPIDLEYEILHYDNEEEEGCRGEKCKNCEYYEECAFERDENRLYGLAKEAYNEVMSILSEIQEETDKDCSHLKSAEMREIVSMLFRAMEETKEDYLDNLVNRTNISPDNFEKEIFKNTKEIFEDTIKTFNDWFCLFGCKDMIEYSKAFAKRLEEKAKEY